MSKQVTISEFDPRSIPLSCTWIVVGPPASGKTSFIEDMVYNVKDRYPVGRAWIGTEGAYDKFCKIMGKLYVSNYYDIDEIRSHIMRQRTCGAETDTKDPNNAAVMILDDVADDPKIFKTKEMRGLFKNGSQHWTQLAMVGLQYAIDVPPDIRKSVSYIALFREPNPTEREKLYKNFGGIVGTKEDFNDIMDQLTGDYTCVIIKNRSQSNDIQDNVFYYKGKVHGDWKFGCHEYREHAKARYDPNYVEQVIM